jgi:predicted protein tyrosine phosphatase
MSESSCAIKVLVLCSRNQWRSPTAEQLINEMPGYVARSAGTAAAARVRVNEKLIGWADLILVMEHRHGQRLREEFGDALFGKTMRCLDVQDEYTYMDPELVELLMRRLAEVLTRDS